MTVKLCRCKHKDNLEGSCVYTYCPRNESKYRFFNAWNENRIYCDYNEDYLKNMYDIIFYRLEEFDKLDNERGLTPNEIDVVNKLTFEIMDIEEKLGVHDA